MLNKICFQGRLVADPEMKVTPSGAALCSLTIAWSEKYKDTEKKCFLRCTAWRGTAEFLEKYFKKGQMIAIEGYLTTEEWEHEGQRRSAINCTIDKVHFCGSKEGGVTNVQPADGLEIEPLDDMPF